MQTYLDNIPNPHENLFQIIRLCNSRPEKCFVSTEFKLSFVKSDKAPDVKVIEIFFNYLRQKVNANGPEGFRQIPLHKWQEIKTELWTFVEGSKEIAPEVKKSFFVKIVDNVQIYIDRISPLNRVKLLTIKQEKTGALDAAAMRTLETTLAQLASERATLYIATLVEFAEFQTNLLLEAFEESGGAIKHYENQSFSIDWERIQKQTPDEFAISLQLERAHHDGKADFKPKLCCLVQEISETETELQPILRKWLLFLGVCESYAVGHNLRELLQAKNGPFKDYFTAGEQSQFFIDETQSLLEQIRSKLRDPTYQSFSSKTTSYRREYLEKQLEAVTKNSSCFRAKAPDIDAFYERVYNAFHTERKKCKIYHPQEVSDLVGATLPTPDQFRQIPIIDVDVQVITAAIRNDLTSYLQTLSLGDESFTLRKLLYHLHKTDDPQGAVDVVHLYCKYVAIALPKGRKKHAVKPHDASHTGPEVLELVKETSRLVLHEKKPQKKPNRAAKSRPLVDKVENRVPNVVVPAAASAAISDPPARIIRPLPAKKSIAYTTTIFTHTRVRDWMKETPVALQQAPYKDLSAAAKNEAKFLHTYPFLVTQIMRQHVSCQTWVSPKTAKHNRHYSCPGTIEDYSLAHGVIEGIFADCFDGTRDELYHHYFHKMPFSQQLNSFAKKGYEIGLEEVGTEDQHAEDKVVAEAELLDRFKLIQRRYSMEIDDTVKRVRYTLCFPNGM